MVFNLYILIISNLLVSRTPLITVLSTEGLFWVNIPFIIIYYCPFRLPPTGIFGLASGAVGILRTKFALPFLTKRFFALIREFGTGTKSGIGKNPGYKAFS